MGAFSSGYSAALGDILSQVNDAFSGKSSGINVSSVVSELMQVKEQPMTQMQNEQTTINSQISALTNINTQLSALQTSIQSLEDPVNGALSQMTTGSSDSSIVAAAADTTAVAGTHTIAVSKLATTSSSYSGYLTSGSALAGATINVAYGPDSSNPLSTDTINIPTTDTTLQQAADYINSGSSFNYNQIAANLGASASLGTAVSGTLTIETAGTTPTVIYTTKGSDATVNDVINDINSSGQGLTASLGSNGQLTITDTQNRGTGAATALEADTTSGNFNVGTANQFQYNQQSSGTTTATLASTVTGTITITPHAGKAFTTSAGDTTMAALIQDINTNSGYQASLDGGALVITDPNLGSSSSHPLAITSNSFQIDNAAPTWAAASTQPLSNATIPYGVTANVVTDSTGSRLVLTSKTSGADGNLTVTSSATGFTTAAGIDAQLTVDGVPVDSATNTVTGAIQGVTLSLGNTGTTQITVEPDTNGAATALQNFVTAYNAVIGSINSQYTLDANGNEGVLAGDSMLRTLQSEMLNMISTSVSGVGNYVNLQSMGIEMQNDGTLQINSSALSTALSSDYSDVQSFFQSTSPQGWGQVANTEMTQLTDPTLGPVAADINGLTQTNDDLTNQISDFQANMADMQQALTTQYDNLDSLLLQYPLQMQEAAAQLASLPDSTTSSNSNSSGLG